MRRIVGAAVAVGLLLAAPVVVRARALTSEVTELDRIPSVRPEYPVPNDPDMLFYIQRSVNSNTLVYAAHLDASGHVDPDDPVAAYWRWFNVDGDRKPLNFIERTMAYGVRAVTRRASQGIAFKVVALPERELLLTQGEAGHPEALIKLGNHTAKLVYVYLLVDDSGLTPTVTALDIFGIDTLTGKALREHVIPH